MVTYTNNHAHLTGRNPKKLVDFYTKVMGAKVNREFLLSGHPAWDLDLGGLLIRISGWSNADDVLEKRYSMANGKDRYGLHHLAMTVSDMDQAYKELTAAGAEFIQPPKSTSPTSKVAFIIAPENVLFELIWRQA